MSNPSLSQVTPEVFLPIGDHARMKAIVQERYGSPDVLEFKEVERPTPKDNEVLVRVSAASLNAGDWHLMRGKPFLTRLMGFGLMKPKDKILGSDIAGRVEAGEVVPVIDRRFPLSETAEAIRYLEQGHAQGKVVISVSPA